MDAEETVQRWPDAEFETSNPNQLRDILKAVGVIVKETQIDIDETGLKTIQMDPSNVAMVDLSVGAYAFDRFYVIRPGVFCFNVAEVLKLVFKKILKNAHLKATVGEEKIIFEIRDGLKRQKHIPLLEPLEEEVPKPRLHHMAKVRMSSDTLKRIVDDIQVSGHIAIEADSDGVIFKAQGDMGKETYPLMRGDENLFDLNVDGSQKATYTLSYLRDIVKGLKPLCDAVELKFSNEMPIQITAEISFDGHLIYYLAPCIGV